MATNEDVSPGDRVSWGVTWEVKVDGEKVWAKGEVSIVVREGETAEAVWDRANRVVIKYFETNVVKTGQALVEANQRQAAQ